MKDVMKLILFFIAVAVCGFVVLCLPIFFMQIVGYIHFKMLNVPNTLIYSEGSFPEVSFILLIIIIFATLFINIQFIKKGKIKRIIPIKKVVPIVILMLMFMGCSNFWLVSKNKIYISSLASLGFTNKYDYSDVKDINISVDSGPKGSMSMNVNLDVKGHKININESSGGYESERNIIRVLKTKYSVPISVDKHGHAKYDDEINYILDK